MPSVKFAHGEPPHLLSPEFAGIRPSGVDCGHLVGESRGGGLPVNPSLV